MRNTLIFILLLGLMCMDIYVQLNQTNKEAVFEELIVKARKDNTVKVWVEFNIPFQPDRLLSKSNIAT